MNRKPKRRGRDSSEPSTQLIDQKQLATATSSPDLSCVLSPVIVSDHGFSPVVTCFVPLGQTIFSFVPLGQIREAENASFCASSAGFSASVAGLSQWDKCPNKRRILQVSLRASLPHNTVADASTQGGVPTRRSDDDLHPRNGHTLVAGIVARISGCAKQREVSLDDQDDHGKEEVVELYQGPVEYRHLGRKDALAKMEQITFVTPAASDQARTGEDSSPAQNS